jgi:hypothetical protein
MSSTKTKCNATCKNGTKCYNYGKAQFGGYCGTHKQKYLSPLAKLEESMEKVSVSDTESEIDEDDFKCKRCLTVQSNNMCWLCDEDKCENICEECFGEGGEFCAVWVCHKHLPICLLCKSKLYHMDDECCGRGRSDDDQ